LSNPKRERHEGKPDQSPGFRGEHVPSSAAHPKWRVGNADRAPGLRVDLTQPVRLTGQWRHTDETYHVFINHAGPHIELLIALVEHGNVGKTSDNPRDKARTSNRVFRMGGDVDASDRNLYRLYSQNPQAIDNKDLVCGTLRIKGRGTHVQFALDFSQHEVTQAVTKLQAIASSTAERIGDTPNLFENYLHKAWVPVEVRTALWFPPTPKQTATLGSFLLDERIQLDSDNYLQHPIKSPGMFGYEDLVERYFAIQGTAGAFDKLSPQERQWMSNIGSALDALVKRARSSAQQLPAKDGGMDSLGEDGWRVATLQRLADQNLEITAGYSRSLLTHTYAILDGVPKSASLVNFEQLLHLAPAAGGHDYDAEIELIPLDGMASDGKKLEKVLRKIAKEQAKKLSKQLKRRIPWGVMAGSLTVKKLGVGPFEATYLLLMGGLQFSRSAGTGTVAVKSSGKAERVYGQAWRPEDLPGAAQFIEAGGSLFVRKQGKGISGTLLRCQGSGAGKPPTPLNINFSGLSDIVSPGAGGGVSVAGYVGWIVPITSEGGGVEFDVPEDDVPFDYGVHTSSGPLHFPINGAQLTHDATALLEIFAACELPVLSRRGVALEVHGFADQPGTDFSNKILSRNRAISVYNYIKSILGNDLAAPELRDVVSEAVEKSRADRLGEKYVPEDPSNGEAAKIVAWGEQGEAEQSGGARYDSRHRRAEIYVNGQVRLMLRRKDDQ
jgi:hypothetical protein